MSCKAKKIARAVTYLDIVKKNWISMCWNNTKSAVIFDMGHSLSLSSQSTHFPKIVQLLKSNAKHLQQQPFSYWINSQPFGFVGFEFFIAFLFIFYWFGSTSNIATWFCQVESIKIFNHLFNTSSKTSDAWKY